MSLLSRLARTIGFGSDADDNGHSADAARNPIEPNRQPVRPTDADDVLLTPEGRYRAGGYSFSTEHQARDFLRRHKQPLGASEAIRAAVQLARRLEEQRPAYRPPEFTPARPSTATGSRREPLHWVAGPARETIGGVSFDAHLVYIGARDQQAWPRNQSAIDPALPVGGRDDPDGGALSWSPDYSYMTPETRRNYLIWLAAGRPGGSTIGYVKLYFGGLERRLLLDNSKTEAPAILVELRRLIDLYGDHYDFGWTRTIRAGSRSCSSAPIVTRSMCDRSAVCSSA